MNENKYNNPQEDLITSSFKASLLFNGLPQATRDDSLTKITDQLNSFKKKIHGKSPKELALLQLIESNITFTQNISNHNWEKLWSLNFNAAFGKESTKISDIVSNLSTINEKNIYFVYNIGLCLRNLKEYQISIQIFEKLQDYLQSFEKEFRILSLFVISEIFYIALEYLSSSPTDSELIPLMTLIKLDQYFQSIIDDYLGTQLDFYNYSMSVFLFKILFIKSQLFFLKSNYSELFLNVETKFSIITNFLINKKSSSSLLPSPISTLEHNFLVDEDLLLIHLIGSIDENEEHNYNKSSIVKINLSIDYLIPKIEIIKNYLTAKNQPSQLNPLNTFKDYKTICNCANLLMKNKCYSLAYCYFQEAYEQLLSCKSTMPQSVHTSLQAKILTNMALSSLYTKYPLEAYYLYLIAISLDSSLLNDIQIHLRISESCIQYTSQTSQPFPPTTSLLPKGFIQRYQIKIQQPLASQPTQTPPNDLISSISSSISPIFKEYLQCNYRSARYFLFRAYIYMTLNISHTDLEFSSLPHTTKQLHLVLYNLAFVSLRLNDPNISLSYLDQLLSSEYINKYDIVNLKAEAYFMKNQLQNSLDIISSANLMLHSSPTLTSISSASNPSSPPSQIKSPEQKSPPTSSIPPNALHSTSSILHNAIHFPPTILKQPLTEPLHSIIFKANEIILKTLLNDDRNKSSNLINDFLTKYPTFSPMKKHQLYLALISGNREEIKAIIQSINKITISYSIS